MKRLCFLILFVSGFGWNAQSAYKVLVLEQSVEMEDERAARRKAIDRATDQVTIDMVRAAIGQARFDENQAKINKEVKGLKNRFIPYFKIINSEFKDGSHHFQIEIKVSEADLREVLQQKGIFANDEKTGITLPFIEVNNQVSGESFRWWSPVFTVSKDLENLSMIFEQDLFRGFLDQGLFLLRPHAFNMVHMVPDFLRKTYLTQTEMVQITNAKKGQLYLDGRIDVTASPLRSDSLRIRVQLSCKQSANGKSVAEVVRSIDGVTGKKLNQMGTEIKELAMETGKDIATQVYELWQRGALESQVLQLAVTGELNHQQLTQFKKILGEKIGLSEGLTERLFEPGRVTFEMDYSGGVEALATKLSKTRFEGYISQVVSTQPDQITLEVKVAK